MQVNQKLNYRQEDLEREIERVVRRILN